MRNLTSNFSGQRAEDLFAFSLSPRLFQDGVGLLPVGRDLRYAWRGRVALLARVHGKFVPSTHG